LASSGALNPPVGDVRLDPSRLYSPTIWTAFKFGHTLSVRSDNFFESRRDLAPGPRMLFRQRLTPHSDDHSNGVWASGQSMPWPAVSDVFVRGDENSLVACAVDKDCYGL